MKNQNPIYHSIFFERESEVKIRKMAEVSKMSEIAFKQHL